MLAEWRETVIFALLDVGIRATLLSLIVAVVLRVARVSTGVQHAVWTSVVCAMLLMPVLAHIVPPVRMSIPTFARTVTAVPAPRVQSVPPASIRSVVTEPRSAATVLPDDRRISEPVTVRPAADTRN